MKLNGDNLAVFSHKKVLQQFLASLTTSDAQSKFVEQGISANLDWFKDLFL